MKTSFSAAWLAMIGALACGCGSAPPPPVVEVAPPAAAEPGAAKQVASGDATQARPRDVAKRVVDGAGYRYEVPADWEELDASALGSPLIDHAQRSRTPTGSFAQNVNVAAEPFTGDGHAYASANLLELKQVATIRREGAVPVGPRPGWDIEASWPNPGAVPYVTLQRYATNGTEGFVITCSTGEASFAKDRVICDDILDSFRVH